MIRRTIDNIFTGALALLIVLAVFACLWWVAINAPWWVVITLFVLAVCFCIGSSINRVP